MNRYLTKSRYKEGLECITKLYYTRKENEYENQSINDPFLLALAEGGFQVGELAKFLFCNNPIEEQITIEEKGNTESLRATDIKFNSSDYVVIAEAAFAFENLFIRADIIVKEKKTINLYEVKAKSFDGDEVDNTNSFLAFLNKENEGIKSNWVGYLYDLAFQKYVITKAFPDYNVKAHLVLTNKSALASINGLNQLFQIEKNNGQTKAIVKEGLQKTDLGNSILTTINLDEIVNKIWYTYKLPTTYGDHLTFEEYVSLCSETYKNDIRIFAPVTSACKNCNYQVNPGDTTKKSGLLECWKNHTNYSDELLSRPLAFELWNGRVNKQIEDGYYLLENIPEHSIATKPKKKTTIESAGLTQEERRLMQIRKTKENDTTFYFDKRGFESELNEWTWPLHMIDFETSTVALPFYKNTSPYQGCAFQFSHHIMHQDGRIEHFNQFIHFEKAVYPNLHFIRSLKESLTKMGGTIFRYHNHENTYLRMIYIEIEKGLGELENTEKSQLLEFIDNITRQKIDNKGEYILGTRNMVDLYQIVIKYYYSTSAKGKAGLKYILPAIINDSDYLKNKYCKKGVYGKGLEINSLNFDDHQWINSNYNNDPYKTLPKIFEDWDQKIIDAMIENFDNVADGGAALTAYNYLQFSHISEEERLALKNALLRYCELDTMAMVILVEGLMNLNEKLN